MKPSGKSKAKHENLPSTLRKHRLEVSNKGIQFREKLPVFSAKGYIHKFRIQLFKG